MPTTPRFSPLLLALCLFLTLPAASVTITLDALDSGFITEAGGSAKGDGTIALPATYNYSAGRELHYATGALGATLAPMDRNNYFVFDLSGIGAPIISAKLALYTGIYESVDATETFDILAPLDAGAALSDAALLLAENAIGAAAFDDPTDLAVLTAMALYGNIESSLIPALGSLVMDAGMDDSVVDIDLIDLAYLNAFAGGMLFLGGSVPTAVGDPFPQQPFGFTGPDIPGGDPLGPKLILELGAAPAPTPGTLALMALGVLLFAVLLQRRQL